MPSFEGTIDVDVPLWAAFEEWADITSFPLYMEGVEEVRDLGGGRLHWRVEIAGKEETWDAEITERVANERIAWRSVSGAKHAGVVTFVPMSDTTTAVNLRIDYDPEGFVENVGAALGVVERRVMSDLEAFKSHAEAKHKGRGWHDPVERLRRPGPPGR